jgi:hypothetical protein
MTTQEEFFQNREPLSYQERLVIGYMLGSFLGVGYFASFAIQQFKLGAFQLMTIPSSWGIHMLKTIAVQIVGTIIISILISIVHAIITRDEDFSEGDERDKLIDLKGNQVSFILFSLGFLASIITLAIGLPPLVMFNTIIFSLFISSIIGYIIQLRIYKRGF